MPLERNQGTAKLSRCVSDLPAKRLQNLGHGVSQILAPARRSERCEAQRVGRSVPDRRNLGGGCRVLTHLTARAPAVRDGPPYLVRFSG
jgi:hypothetical protein